MADNVVDNSPEMPLDDPRVAEFLAKAEGREVEPKPEEKKGVKAKPAASPAREKAADDATDEDEGVDETREQLKAQRDGLKAELARRQGNSAKVDELEQELAAIKTKLTAPTESKFSWVRKLDDDALASKHTDWDDELSDARAKYGRAEEAGDERAMERQGQRILAAKETLSAFRKETLDRTRREAADAEANSREAQSIQSEIDEMHDAVADAYPEMLTKGSEQWEAANKEFIEHPKLMQQLGPLGEIVAIAMSHIRNPELGGKKTASAARKDVLGKLDKGIKRSLSTGATAPSTQRSVDYTGAVGDADGLAKFNAMIDRFKGG